MKTEQIKLKQVKTNTDNPRSCTATKMAQLINSILVFPKMLELRPIVVDTKMAALGGNMRNLALKEIEKMTPEQIAARLHSQADYLERTDGEKKALLDFWGKWLESPYAFIIKASELSEAEKKQFIIKDNVQFGTWDYDKLANKWDDKKLGDWGMDVWTTAPAAFTPMTSTSSSQQPLEPAASEDDGEGTIFANLPPELQGQDLMPDALPKIQGDDATAMDRIIITYPKDRVQEVAQLIGLAAIDKVVYRIDEIIPECAV